MAAKASASRRASVRRIVASAGTEIVVGGIPAGAQRGPDRLRGVRSPLRDRGDRPGAGQDRSGGQREDGDERMPPPGGGSWVGMVAR
jgi:hypothetical protein